MPRLFFLVCCAFVLAGTLAADAPVTDGKEPVLQAGQPKLPVKPEPQAEKVNVELQKAGTKPQGTVDQQKAGEVTEAPKVETQTGNGEKKGEQSVKAAAEEKAQTQTQAPTETTTQTQKPTEVTTQPPKPSTSTVPPSPPTTQATTTVAPVTTTAAPTPAPVPTQGKWTVNVTGKVCVLVQMAAQFNVTYNTTDNKKAYALFTVPSANLTVANGSCGEKEQNLTISWSQTVNSTWDNFTLHFMKNETTGRYSLHHLELQVPGAAFPNANFSEPVLLVHKDPSFSTSLTNSYRCIKQQKLEVTGTNNVTGHVALSDLQFQAFRSDNSTTFGLAKDCAFDVPDVVPIAVGCALAGLVVVVLIAYLVSRRRSQNRGYLSM